MELQNDLFSGTRLVQRLVPSSGSTVRLRLEAVGEGIVRVLEYHRRARGARHFRRVGSEELRVVPFDGLRLEVPFEALFGSATPWSHGAESDGESVETERVQTDAVS